MVNGVLFNGVEVGLMPQSLTLGGTWKDRLPNGKSVAYDSNLIKFLYEQIKERENPIVLDIGASTGSFALLGVAHPSLWVTAFEPNPEVAHVLGKNVELNGLENRVKILTCALLDVNGKTELKVPRDPVKIGLATLGKPTRFTEYEAIKVPVQKLDSIAGLGPADIIKIDAEGAELLILKGGEQYIKAHRPAILLEYYPANTKQFGYEPRAIRDLLEAWGYSCQKKGKEDLWATYAEK